MPREVRNAWGMAVEVPTLDDAPEHQWLGGSSGETKGVYVVPEYRRRAPGADPAIGFANPVAHVGAAAGPYGHGEKAARQRAIDVFREDGARRAWVIVAVTPDHAASLVAGEIKGVSYNSLIEIVELDKSWSDSPDRSG